MPNNFRLTTALATAVILFSVSQWFLTVPLYAQQLTLERTIEGTIANFRTSLNMLRSSADRLDLNGDGVPEQIFLGATGGDFDHLRIVNGANPLNQLLVPDTSPDSILKSDLFFLVGCFDLDGDVTGGDFESTSNPKEIIVGERVQVDAQNRQLEVTNVHVASYINNTELWDWRRLGIIGILISLVDVDDDGKVEVITYEPGDGSEGSKDKILVYGFN